MPRKDLSLAEKIALLGQIKDHSPSTSHRRLAEITGVFIRINDLLLGEM
jgi:hypothetical protein